jgi:hypothetical protein
MRLHCVAGWNSYHISELLASHAPPHTHTALLSRSQEVLIVTSDMALKAPFTE